MLPDPELARILAQRRLVEAERAAWDHAAEQDRHAGSVRPAASSDGQAPRPGAGTRPCPPPCPRAARGVAG
jgi:hypothetical protein